MKYNFPGKWVGGEFASLSDDLRLRHLLRIRSKLLRDRSIPIINGDAKSRGKYRRGYCLASVGRDFTSAFRFQEFCLQSGGGGGDWKGNVRSSLNVYINKKNMEIFLHRIQAKKLPVRSIFRSRFNGDGGCRNGCR